MNLTAKVIVGMVVGIALGLAIKQLDDLLQIGIKTER